MSELPFSVFRFKLLAGRGPRFVAFNDSLCWLQGLLNAAKVCNGTVTALALFLKHLAIFYILRRGFIAIIDVS